MAILLGERRGEACAAALKTDEDVIISAGTVAEALVVAARRNVSAQMLRLVEDLGMEVVPVTLGSAQRVAQAYAQWGRGALSIPTPRQALEDLKGELHNY